MVPVLLQGDIDDIQIFREFGIIKYLEPNDMVLADRGFTVRELLNPLQVELRIPSFLKGRGSLTAAAELETRRIAKARIHVERFNERLKQFKLVGRKIPLPLAPLATQMVVVAASLVNFQNTLCKYRFILNHKDFIISWPIKFAPHLLSLHQDVCYKISVFSHEPVF